MLPGRLFIVVCALVALSACSTTKPVVQPAAYVAPEIIIQKPQIDVMTAFDNGSVTVYPLRGDVRNPFSDKKLQPISQKVIGEGYPVLDPSVTVYPLRPPTSIPSVAFDDVQTGAASNLYSAKVKALASQRPIDAEFPALPPTNGAIMPMNARDVIGAGQSEIKESALPPITGPAIDVPELPAVAVQPKRAPSEIFTPVGKKMGPVGSKPVQMPAAAPPVTAVPKASSAPKMQPVYDDAPPPIPVADPLPIAAEPLPAKVSTMPMTPPPAPKPAPKAKAPEAMPIPQANDAPPANTSDMQEGDVVPMPPIPSLTGY